MRESKIESEVGKYVKSKGGLFYKFTSPGRKGVPDRLVIRPGVVPFFIEFKATGKTLRPDQERERRRLEDRSCRAYTCDSIELGKEIIDIEIANLRRKVRYDRVVSKKLVEKRDA